jgi:hypothetical protein
MSSLNETLIQPTPNSSLVGQQELSSKKSTVMMDNEKEDFVEQRYEVSTTESDPDVVLVDFDENDPENPLNWSSMHKWLIIFAISWMGFVR